MQVGAADAAGGAYGRVGGVLVRMYEETQHRLSRFLPGDTNSGYLLGTAAPSYSRQLCGAFGAPDPSVHWTAMAALGGTRVTLLAHGHLVRECLGSSLARAGFAVDAAGDDNLVDVVVVASEGGPGEIRPLMDTARRKHPRKPLLVLGPDRREDIIEAISGDATEYVSFEASLQELASKVRAVASGRLPMATIPRQTIDVEEKSLNRRTVDRLNDREREVLRSIVRGASTREIAVALGVTTSAVRAHVHRILAKLEVHSRLEAAAVAAQRGIQ